MQILTKRSSTKQRFHRFFQQITLFSRTNFLCSFFQITQYNDIVPSKCDLIFQFFCSMLPRFPVRNNKIPIMKYFCLDHMILSMENEQSEEWIKGCVTDICSEAVSNQFYVNFYLDDYCQYFKFIVTVTKTERFQQRSLLVSTLN